MVIGELLAHLKLKNELTSAMRQAAKDVAPAVTEIKRQVDSTSVSAKNLGDSGIEAGLNLGQAFRGFLALGVVQQVTAGIGAIVDTVDELDTMASKLGDTVENVQGLKAIATEFDTSLTAIVGGIQELRTNLGEGDLDEPLRQLNIEVERFRRLNSTEQYLQAAEALGAIEDPAKRAALAKEIFGRSAKELAGTLRTDVRDGLSGVLVMSNETAEGIDTLSRLWDKGKQSAHAFGAELLVTVTGMRAYHEIQELIAGGPPLPDVKAPAMFTPSELKPPTMNPDEYKRVGKELDDIREKGRRLAEEFKRGQDALFGRDLIARAQTYAKQLGEISNVATLTKEKKADLRQAVEKALEAYKALGQQAPEQLRAIHAATTPLLETTRDLSKTPSGSWFAGLVPLKGTLADAGRELQHIANGLETNGDLMSGTIQDLGAAQRAAAEWAHTNGAILAPSIQDTRREIAGAAADTRHWSDETGMLALTLGALSGASGVIGDVGRQIFDVVKALRERNRAIAEGRTLEGLSLRQSAGAGLGAGIGAALQGGSWRQQLGQVAAAAAGTAAMAATATAATVGSIAAAGALTFGIGAAAIGVGLLIRKWTGVSKEIKEARKLVADFQGELAKTLTKDQLKEAGGEEWKATVIAVREAYKGIGRNAAEAEAIVKQLWNTDDPKAAAEAVQEIARALEQLDERRQAVNSTLPELFAAIEDEGGVMADSIRAGVEQLVAMGLVSEENLAKFRALASNTEIDTKKMQEAAQRYGIDLAGLGQRFNAARLHESATQIWRDFVMLRAGGADVGTVLTGMKDEILALANDSVRLGTTIPQQFKPLIANLANSTELTEEQRAQLNALGDSNFGDPIVTQLEKITAKFDELIEKIINGVAPALANLPSPDIRFPDMPTIREGDSTRGDGSREVQGFARGTLGVFGSAFHDFKQTGELAMLHGREGVFTEEQFGSMLGSAFRSGSMLGDMRHGEPRIDYGRLSDAIEAGLIRTGDSVRPGGGSGREVVENTYLMPVLIPSSDNPNDIADEVIRTIPRKGGANDGGLRTFIADIARGVAREEINRAH